MMATGCAQRSFWQAAASDANGALIPRVGRSTKSSPIMPISAKAAIRADPSALRDWTRLQGISTPALCTFCGECVTACPEKALQLACEEMEADTIMDQIRRDEIFFRHSGGGVTFSGGEPFVQHQFLRRLMDGCEKLGVSVWVESCGFFKWDHCQDLMAGIDHIFFDIKHMDSETHRQFTGQGNEVILQNAKRIHAAGVPMTVRIPLIVEVNLADSNLQATAEFMREQLPGCGIELLPYHELGKAKYSAFRMTGRFHSFTTPTEAQVEAAYRIFKNHGIPITPTG